MQLSPRRLFLLILSALLLPCASANAQTGASYRFLEVLDGEGKPIANASVVTNTSTHQTDGHGVVKQLPIYFGDFNTRSLRVSKPGYFPHDDPGVLFPSDRYRRLLFGEVPRYEREGLTRVELLKIPGNAAETKALERAQNRRQMIVAATEGDVANVRRLLQAGVDANTADLYGIPIILLAVTSGNVPTVEALVAGGATIGAKDKPGIRALLYYLHFAPVGGISTKLVRKLIKAGADVNAVDWQSESVRKLAEAKGDAALVKLLESAGAHHQ